MIRFFFGVACVLSCIAPSKGFNVNTAFSSVNKLKCMKSSRIQMNLRPNSENTAALSRRSLLGSAGALIAGNVFEKIKPASAKLDPRPPSPDDLLVYFGAGCFWHVQHEFIVAEEKILGRNSNSFTTVVGYAGGSKVGSDGKVCYHNLLFDSDYGKLGHTEVVAVRVPEDRLLFFCEQYLRLFNSAGVRADPQDRGGEYRSAIGFPGGFSNPAVAVMQEFAGDKGMKLVPGKGDEPDTLKDKTIYVYDTAQFPFYPGELYHQYHDDMVEKYGPDYAAMRQPAVARGTLAVSKCPGDKGLGL